MSFKDKIWSRTTQLERELAELKVGFQMLLDRVDVLEGPPPLLRPNTYDAKIVAATAKMTRSTKRPYLSVEFADIVGHPRNRVWMNLTTHAMSQLEQVCYDMGIDTSVMRSEVPLATLQKIGDRMVGRRCTIAVRIRAYSDKEFNEVHHIVPREDPV